jgi:hypothetical protein
MKGIRKGESYWHELYVLVGCQEEVGGSKENRRQLLSGVDAMPAPASLAPE